MFGSLFAGSSRVAAAQRLVPPLYAEYRADAIVGSGTALEAGGGAVVPLGAYVRLGIDGAAGETWRSELSSASGRVDAIGRFLLDPYREDRIGFSLGGGVSVPLVQHETHVRPYLAAVMDVEGRMRGPITPAVQIGLGGGARIGFVLRTSP
ncbi:MAG TPA: hypothetical protein VHV78_10445, partial [Gemmatimonadaceae bacterium]|nr:hypothetical protein [Gemmatimonadaceae bacterium]